MLGIAHDIRNVVHNAAVRLLRQALVKAAVPGLHVEDRNVQPLGGDDGQAGIGIAQNQQGIGLLFHHQGVGLGNNVADGFTQVLADGIQIEIRRTQAQILKEHLIQVIIIVLAGVD